MFDDLPASSDGWAFFLDIDGTLLDIAPTPDAVVTPPELPVVLDALCRQVGGALALLTGRAFATVDSLFAPARLPVGGVHGTELRFPDGKIVVPPVPLSLESVRRRFVDFVAGQPEIFFEDKGLAVALHYRAAPRLAGLVETEVRAAAESAGDDLVVQPGKMVFEVRPSHASKGRALAAFMAHAVFAARRPVAIGDDVTDESMFAEARRRGGSALRVGPAAEGSIARPAFDRPEAVRLWLAGLIRPQSQHLDEKAGIRGSTD